MTISAGSNNTQSTDGGDLYLDEVRDFLHEVEAPEFSPFGALGRMMRGRWLMFIGLSLVLGVAFAIVGMSFGAKKYESQAILRVYPSQANILYKTGDGSVLKTFEAYVKAETTYVASHPVMSRAYEELTREFPEQAYEFAASDLAGAIEVKRKESLIILTTKSTSAEFSAGMLSAVVNAYIALQQENLEKLASFREGELVKREDELLGNLDGIKEELLAVGGEYGVAALTKAHIEKVAQIDSLMARTTEVEATLLALQQDSGASGADMADQEIIRATLLDRALADLNFDRAKREAELVTLLARYADNTAEVKDKKQQIKIISKAMSERREQIKVLGQTGALTDTSSATPEDSINEMRSLYEKVAGQLEAARTEATRLNVKLVQLGFLEDERDEMRRMLDETRQAIDVITLESRNLSPGLTDLMAPPIVADKPESDSAKILGAVGFIGGGFIATVITILMIIINGSIRFSDELWRTVHLTPILRVIGRKAKKRPATMALEIDKLRNAIKLLPARAPRSVGKAKVISVVRFDSGAPSDVAKMLAESFSSAHLNTLLVDADLVHGELSKKLGFSDEKGWRELVRDGETSQVTLPDDGIQFVPIGLDETMNDSTAGVASVRKAIRKLANGPDVVIVNGGSFKDSLSSELLASASDLCIGVIKIGDARRPIENFIDRLDTLPRNGGAILITDAKNSDPGLTGG
jgi:succinoglycan biosynthesis transport protein ExoP